MPTPPTTDDSIETETDPEQPSDWQAAVLDAIEHLESHDVTGPDVPEGKQAFGLKAAHDRLARLNTSDATRDVAETIRDVADLLAEVPDVPSDEWGVIAGTALAQLAPLAARAARDTPGPFFETLDDLPAIIEPTPAEREMAEAYFGADNVPDEDVIPHYHPFHHVPIEIEVSEFTLDAIRRRLEGADNLDRGNVLDDLGSFVTVEEQYRTPDGLDAVEVLLDELGDE